VTETQNRKINFTEDGFSDLKPFATSASDVLVGSVRSRSGPNIALRGQIDADDPSGVRQESRQRIGGESPPRGSSSQPPRPRVMRGVPRGPT
jgi:hypothetical protein